MRNLRRMLTVDLIKHYLLLRKLESNSVFNYVRDKIGDCIDELTIRASRNDEEAFQFVSVHLTYH